MSLTKWLFFKINIKLRNNIISVIINDIEQFPVRPVASYQYQYISVGGKRDFQAILKPFSSIRSFRFLGFSSVINLSGGTFTYSTGILITSLYCFENCTNIQMITAKNRKNKNELKLVRLNRALLTVLICLSMFKK